MNKKELRELNDKKIVDSYLQKEKEEVAEYKENCFKWLLEGLEENKKEQEKKIKEIRNIAMVKRGNLVIRLKEIAKSLNKMAEYIAEEDDQREFFYE